MSASATKTKTKSKAAIVPPKKAPRVVSPESRRAASPKRDSPARDRSRSPKRAPPSADATDEPAAAAAPEAPAASAALPMDYLEPAVVPPAASAAPAAAPPAAAPAAESEFDSPISDEALLEAERKASEYNELTKNAEAVYEDAKTGESSYFSRYKLSKEKGKSDIEFKAIETKTKSRDGKGVINKRVIVAVDKRKGASFGKPAKIRSPFMLTGPGVEAWPYGDFAPASTRKTTKEFPNNFINKAKLSIPLTTRAWNFKRQDSAGMDVRAMEFAAWMQFLVRYVYTPFAAVHVEKASKLFMRLKDDPYLQQGLENKLEGQLGRKPTADETQTALLDELYERHCKKVFFGQKNEANKLLLDGGNTMYVSGYLMSKYRNEWTINDEKRIEVRRGPTEQKDRELRASVASLIHECKLMPVARPLRTASRIDPLTNQQAIIPYQDRDLCGGDVLSVVFSLAPDFDEPHDQLYYLVPDYLDGTLLKRGVKAVEHSVSQVIAGAEAFAPAPRRSVSEDGGALEDDGGAKMMLFNPTMMGDKQNKGGEASAASASSSSSSALAKSK